MLTICDTVLQTENLRPDDKYWVMATRAEACLGMGDEDRANQQLEEAFAIASKPWMRESTQDQMGKLRGLLGDSPLKFVRADSQ